MKGRFVVVDMGATVHQRSEACPPWCHLCPHMHGAVMPYCYGSVVSNYDENDLLACTCNPNDPVVAHHDLVARTTTLLALLREKRRDRQYKRSYVKRLAELAKMMQWSTDQRGLSAAWQEVANIAQRLSRSAEPTQADDAVARTTD